MAQSVCKGVHVHAAAVEGLPDPGMENQPGQRIAVENVQKFGKFRRIPEADPGFDGNRHRRGGENLVQKPAQPVPVRQHSRALPLGHHGTGGTAQIEIDLPVPPFGALAGHPEKIRRVPGEQLGYRFGTEGCGGWQLQLLPMSQAAVDGGGEKGGIVPV